MADELILRPGDKGYRLLEIYLGLPPERQAQIDQISLRHKRCEDRQNPPHLEKPSLYRGLSNEILSLPLKEIIPVLPYVTARIERGVQWRHWPCIDLRTLAEFTLKDLFDIDEELGVDRLRGVGRKACVFLNACISNVLSSFPDVLPQAERCSSESVERYLFFQE